MRPQLRPRVQPSKPQKPQKSKELLLGLPEFTITHIDLNKTNFGNKTFLNMDLPQDRAEKSVTALMSSYAVSEDRYPIIAGNKSARKQVIKLQNH